MITKQNLNFTPKKKKLHKKSFLFAKIQRIDKNIAYPNKLVKQHLIAIVNLIFFSNRIDWYFNFSLVFPFSFQTEKNLFSQGNYFQTSLLPLVHSGCVLFLRMYVCVCEWGKTLLFSFRESQKTNTTNKLEQIHFFCVWFFFGWFFFCNTEFTDNRSVAVHFNLSAHTKNSIF